MGGGAKFGAFSPTSVLYRKFPDGMHAMADSEDLPFTIIISDPLSNSFGSPVQLLRGPCPHQRCCPIVEVQQEDIRDCYDSYVEEGMEVEDCERSHEELVLNDIRTENYQEDDGDIC